MATVITLTAPGIGPDQVKIGQLVTNIWNPIFRFHNPPYDGELVQPFVTSRHDSTIVYRSDSDVSAFAKLTQLFKIKAERDSSVLIRIQAEDSGEQMLPNPASAFNSLYSGEGVQDKAKLLRAREWIQNRAQDEEDIYMVVGIRIIVNAKVEVEIINEQKSSLKAGASLSNMTPLGLATVGVAQTVAKASDLMIGAAVARSRKGGEVHTLDGKWVIAAAYCKLKTDRWTKREGPPRPMGMKWEWYAGTGMRLAVDRNIGRDPLDNYEIGVEVEELDLVEFVGEDDVDVPGVDDGTLTKVVVDGVTLLMERNI